MGVYEHQKPLIANEKTGTRVKLFPESNLPRRY